MSDNEQALRPRLYLVTPAAFEPAAFAPLLASALQGGDVAAVLIAMDDIQAVMAAAEELTPIIQQAGAASLIADESRAVGRANADGFHVSSGFEELKSAIERLRPKYIVGAGGMASRHEAMRVGELGPDYMFFGDLGRPEHDQPHGKMLDLAEWWSELFEIPAVVLAGGALEEIGAVLETGSEFIAAREAVWNYGEGPAAAVARINATIDADFTVIG